MADNVVSNDWKMEKILPEKAKDKQGMLTWLYNVTVQARIKKCEAAIPPIAFLPHLTQQSINQAHVTVSALMAEYAARRELDDTLPEFPGDITAPIPPGRITSATQKQQNDFSGIMFSWTSPEKDHPLFTQFSLSDPDFGTIMLLSILRKYTSFGTQPVVNWIEDLRTPQSDQESAVDVWNRCKMASMALLQAGRPVGRPLLIDMFKSLLGPEHKTWLTLIVSETASLDEVDHMVYQHGNFMDSTSNERAAFSAHSELLAQMQAKIAQLESQLSSASGSSGFPAAGGARAPRNGQRFSGNCNYCGIPGHMKKDCRKLKNKESRNKETNKDSGVAFPACFVAIASFSSTADSAIPTPAVDSDDSTFEESVCFPSHPQYASDLADINYYENLDYSGSDSDSDLESLILETVVDDDVPLCTAPMPIHPDDSANSDYIWDTLLETWIDPSVYPEILVPRFDEATGVYYRSRIDIYGDDRYVDADAALADEWCRFYATETGAVGSLPSSFVRGPQGRRSRRRHHVMTEPSRVTVEDFTVPEFSTQPENLRNATSVLPVRPSHHVRRAIRREQRKRRFERREFRRMSQLCHDHSISTSDASALESVASIATASDILTPGFNVRKFLQWKRLSLRAGMRKRGPRSFATFLGLAHSLGSRYSESFSLSGLGIFSSHRHSRYAISVAKRILFCLPSHQPDVKFSWGASNDYFPYFAFPSHSASPPSGCNPDWLVDTGANEHLSSVRSDFTSFRHLSGHVSGISVAIHGVGDVPISVSSVSATVHDVKYTPDLIDRSLGSFCRIFSVKQAIAKSCHFHFGPSGNTLTLPSGDVIELTSRNGLFWLPATVTSQPSSQPSAAPSSHIPAAAAAGVSMSKTLIHRRTCHLGDDGLNKLVGLRIPGIPTAGMDSRLEFCHCCVLGKSTVADIPRHSCRDHDPHVCFHSMAIDLWGPIQQQAIGGFLYVLGAICFLSNYHLAELLKSKSDAPTAWRRMLLRIRALGYEVVTVRVDNDSVLLSQSFLAVCDEFGVCVDRSVPYRHHQMARIERHWRTMAEAVTALLVDSGLALRFWGFAFLTAAYVKNRVWHSGARGIPFHMVTGTKPDLSHLRVFGCPAYVHIEKPARKKLQPKAWQGVFVGYAFDSPAYLIYNPRTRSVVRSQNVTFHEGWRDTVHASVRDSRSMNLGETIDSDSEMKIEIQVNGHSVPSSSSVDLSSSQTQTSVDDCTATNEILESRRMAAMRGRVTFQLEESPVSGESSDSGESPVSGESPGPHDEFRARLRDVSAMSPGSDRYDATARLLEFADDNDIDDEDALNQIAEHIPASPSTSEDSTAAVAFAADSVPPRHLTEPRSYRQATCESNPYRVQWQNATDNEFNSHITLGTWNLVRLPPGKRAIGSTWVYKVKRGALGQILKWKARLCARGDQQTYGLDYDSTFAPTVKYQSLRTLLALAAYYDLEVEQFDVVTAFLNAELTDAEVYMRQPDGYIKYDTDGTPFVCKLQRAIYGIKQAPAEWNKLLCSWLVTYGFEQSACDAGIYSITNNDHRYFLAVYVDDCIMVGKSSPFIAKFKNDFSKRFKIEDLGPVAWLLGCNITRDRKGRKISIGQRQYCIDMLDLFGMQNCSTVGTPLPAKTLDSDDSFGSPALDIKKSVYPSLVGKLLYLSNCTRPDITAAVNYLSRFMSNATELHMQQAKRLLRYIQGTLDYCITYSGSVSPEPLCWQDASFADGPGRRSRTGLVVLMCGGAVIWASRLQATVALSTVEAEYMALAAACQELLFLRQQLESFGLPMTQPLQMFEDNKGCIALATNAVTTHKTKHIDIKYHFVRQCVASKKVKLVWVETTHMLADILTKFSLPAAQHLSLATRMMSGTYSGPSCQS